MKDIFYRYEWQARGSPHVHSLIWLEGAPILGVDPEEDFIELADSLIHTKVINICAHFGLCTLSQTPKTHNSSSILCANQME